MQKYLKIWWIFTLRTTQIAFESRLGVAIFTLGKFMRFALYLLFLFVLLSKTQSLAGYSIWQIFLFFATFNFIDTTAQFLLREVYRFRPHIISGYFDFILLWPISPLFKTLVGGSDVMDIPMIIVSILFIFITGSHTMFTFAGLIFYLLLVLNALLIALAFHICILALGILTTEIDNTLWMYRDLTQMGRIPVDIYREPVRSIITFVVPVGIMMTFPVKALLGILSTPIIILSLVGGILFLTTSFAFWKFALRYYTSASS